MSHSKFAIATFAMGCFWTPEVVFRNVEGVVDAEVGYTGGHTKNPTYDEVCTDQTGHAEVVRVTFDPSQISYEELLAVFFENHDPTQINRQGPDVGRQYRSAVYYHDQLQREAAEQAIRELQPSLHKPIATEVTEAGRYYRAEDYHQRYLERRGMVSCRI